jgi:hypothetical protein
VIGPRLAWSLVSCRLRCDYFSRSLGDAVDQIEFCLSQLATFQLGYAPRLAAKQLGLPKDLTLKHYTGVL